MAAELKPGTRIELIEMPQDPAPIEPGTQGTVEEHVRPGRGRNYAEQIWVRWDNGRLLALLPDVDRYRAL